MDLPTLFITSFIVGFSGAMVPGPVLTVTVAETPRKGSLTGPIISGGHAIAEIAVVVVLSLGLVALAENATIRRGIAMVGGGMLILMGGGMIYDIFRFKIAELSGTTSGKKSGRLVVDGIVASLSNPYWFIWWATTGSAFIVKSLDHGAVGPAVFYFGHILSDFAWYSFVSLVIWKGRRLVTGYGYKILLALCALFLLYLGGTFIHDGLTGSI
jgi:threonine/homoserine/homoserine lactone efflux protein